MSGRAVEILKEDMDAKGPVKLSEVEKSQQAILKIAQKLAEEGRAEESAGCWRAKAGA